LEITNRVKDQVIGMKEKFIGQLQLEQRSYIERLIDSSHRIGQLKTNQLSCPVPSFHIGGARVVNDNYSFLKL